MADNISGIDKVEPGSVRASIEDAIEIHKDDNPVAERLSNALAEKRERIAELRGEEIEDSQAKVEPIEDTADGASADSKPEEAVSAAGDIPEELKADWHKLKPELQHHVMKTRNEIEKTKAETLRIKQQKQEYEDIDNIVNSHFSRINPAERPPNAQVLSNMLPWIGALNNPDYNVKIAAFQQLAQSFNIDLTKFGDPNFVRELQYQQEQRQYLQEQQQYQQQQRHQWEVQEATKKQLPRVEKWSKNNKPHFEKVRLQMTKILYDMWEGGAIPRDADLGAPAILDRAYNLALQYYPELAEKERSKNIGRRENPSSVRKPQNTNSTVRGAIKQAFEEAKNRD